MSFEFSQYYPSTLPIIMRFLQEVTDILSSKTDFERRVALLEKWIYVFEGLGFGRVDFNPREATPEAVEEAARKLLLRVASYLKGVRA